MYDRSTSTRNSCPSLSHIHSNRPLYLLPFIFLGLTGSIYVPSAAMASWCGCMSLGIIISSKFMSSRVVLSLAAFAYIICYCIMSCCSCGSLSNSSFVIPGGSGGTCGTFILSGAIPSGMPGAGMIWGWPFCKPPYAIIMSCSATICIRSSYCFCRSSWYCTSGGIGSMPSYCFRVSFTGSGGGWFMFGGVAIMGPSIWRSSNSY